MDAKTLAGVCPPRYEKKRPAFTKNARVHEQKTPPSS